MKNHTGKCEDFLETECGGKAFMMPSCTAALELACMMILKPGDEVILPSYAFPSCANAIILRGAVPVFVDVDENHLLTADAVLGAITSKTKAIMPLHYAGVVCDMPALLDLAEKRGLYVIEDAAQALGNWKVSGDFGCLSFHYTKNIECGQGGALIVKNPMFIEKAERMMHCGTDKLKMYRGDQNYYNWLDIGSQYIMSEHQATYLYDQLQRLDEITAHRRLVWKVYSGGCKGVPHHATECGNGHFFWFYKQNKWEFLEKLHTIVKVSSHYEALHNTVPGRKYGRAGDSITQSVMADKFLLKLDTSISQDEALINNEVLWQRNIDCTLNIH